MVDIFAINRQTRIVWVQGGQKIITAHSSLSYILHVRDVDLIDVQAPVLTAKSLFPARLIVVSQYIDDLIPTGRVEYDVRKRVSTSAGSVIFGQWTKIVQDPQLFLDDVFFDRAKVESG